ncbi:AAA family ATPase [Lysinibacillus sp. UGB7]|uniref:AAA family ATPase n=1 Tax=Lysinibacillus sp. UGB7 TaxID=3411039 RepID=UPI003B7D423B
MVNVENLCKCSFCGMPKEDVAKGIEDVWMCNDCAEIKTGVIEDKRLADSEKENGKCAVSNKSKILKPSEIKRELDRFVVGQDDAKRALSVAAYSHLKRINNIEQESVKKSNLLFVGPSGSGKTYMLQKLAECLDVPLYIGDATRLTETGYIGDDIHSLVHNLYYASGKDKERTEQGIIFVDEFDKLSTSNNGIGRKDVTHKPVQEGLLKMIEDTEVTIPSGGGFAAIGSFAGDSSVRISTKNILFIFGGSFVGLEKSTMTVNKQDKVVGFNAVQNEVEPKGPITHSDLIEYGFIPELVGRISLIAELKKLSKEQMRTVLLDIEGSPVSHYKKWFLEEGVSLEFDEDAVDYIIDQAEDDKIGVRGLKAVIEKGLLPLMFEVPNRIGSTIETIVVTRDILAVKVA